MPCCDRRCLVYGCKTREDGACSCACRIVDFINTLESIIHDRGTIKYGSVYLPPDAFKKYQESMTAGQKEERIKEKQWAEKELIGARNFLERYIKPD